MAFELNMTEKTPKVLFDSDKGLFSFTGVVYPEDSMVFFKPLFTYVNVYFMSPRAETTLEIDLEYFNTSASRMIYQMMKVFADQHTLGKSKVKIKWFYEADDLDMEEAGQEFAALFSNLEFEMIIVERKKTFELLNG